MKILILGVNQKGRYNWGHQLFKDAVAKRHNVRFYGSGFKYWNSRRTEIHSIMKMLEFQPAIILSYMGKYCAWVKGLASIEIPKVHIVVDYFPWNYEVENRFIRRNRIDLVLPVCQHEAVLLRRHGFEVRHLPFGVDTEVFQCAGQERRNDIMAIFSVVPWAYPTRRKILEELRKLKVRSLLGESWPKSRLWQRDYVKELCNSKIVVNGVDKCRSLNWKFLESCACGAMLLTEEAEDMGHLGFKDGENCVVFSGMQDLRQKALYYLSKEGESSRKRIAEKGQELVLSRHSLENRVEELTSILHERFG